MLPWDLHMNYPNPSIQESLTDTGVAQLAWAPWDFRTQGSGLVLHSASIFYKATTIGGAPTIKLQYYNGFAWTDHDSDTPLVNTVTAFTVPSALIVPIWRVIYTATGTFVAGVLVYTLDKVTRLASGDIP